jgi:hypothetical protein
MKLQDVYVTWTPFRDGGPLGGDVSLIPAEDIYLYNDLPPWRAEGGPKVENVSGDAAKVYALALFQKMVVVDGIHPKKAHKALIAIDEYRDAIDPSLARKLH